MRFAAHRDVFFMIILLASVLALTPSPTLAATVVKSVVDSCVLRLEGQIVDGDFQRLTDMAKEAFKGFDGESSSHDTLCLNSPGGSVSEGVKLASFIYKSGIGTVIDRGDRCYSICAIMFMMGIAQGPEVSFINRKLDTGGKLGFHRPYLAIDSDEMINVKALAIAHDVAVESITELMILANNQVPWSNSTMMKPDLIQAMLVHVGDDLYYIDTVDKAGRFEIEVVGQPETTGLTSAQAYYACENSFHWQVGLKGQRTNYQRLRVLLGNEVVKVVSDGPGGRIYAVTSEDEGYSEALCLVGLRDGLASGCGYNGSYNVSVGQGQCTVENFSQRAVTIPRLALLRPGLTFSDLDRALSTDDFAWVTCVLFPADGAIEQESCSLRFEDTTAADGQKISKYVFVWPTGNKTIVHRSGREARINGKVAKITYDTGYQLCATNQENNNRFCFKL